jgi:hypothetical protein
VDGVSLRWLELPVEEIFHRFIQFREWHVSEMSMGKYVSAIAEGRLDGRAAGVSVAGLPALGDLRADRRSDRADKASREADRSP